MKAGIRNSYTGIRYVTADNSDSLDPYFIGSAVLSSKLKPGKTSISMNIEIKNLFNSAYETIAWYPMPGRSYTISLIFEI
jgi:iron complex outermembrane receptor protein